MPAVPAPCVVVMVKAPRVGTAKTRLSPPWPSQDAADFAAALAQDTVAMLAQTGLPTIVAYAPHDGRALLQSLLPADIEWTPQRGTDLGERMDAALRDAAALGYSPLLMIGTDCPLLPPQHLAQAVTALQHRAADIVLGPTDDGGFALLGLRAPVPGLLDGVAWSTDAALSGTAANAARLGLRCLLLPPLYDIDTPQDLERLRRDFNSFPTLPTRLPHITAWLRTHP